MRTWLYHKTKPAGIFDTEKGDDLGKLHTDGWRDNPAEAKDTDEPVRGGKPPRGANAPAAKPAPKTKQDGK